MNGQYIGKLKSSHNKIDNVMYNNEEQKEELGGVLFDKPTISQHMRDGAQPRKLRVILPPLDDKRVPIPNKVPYNDPNVGLLGQLQTDVDAGCKLLERKEPVSPSVRSSVLPFIYLFVPPFLLPPSLLPSFLPSFLLPSSPFIACLSLPFL